MEPASQLSIINTLQGVFNSVDKRDWKQCQSYFADKVYVDFSSLNNVPGTVVPSADLIKGWEGFLPKFRFTQHMVTNFDIQANGNKANARFYGHAIHQLPHTKGGDLWGVYGVYEAVLDQTTAGWKITSFTLHLKYQEGNKNMLAAVTDLPVEQKVHFESEGEQITGNLLLPAGYKEGQKLPVIIVFGAWTQVKEQIQYLYGRKLAERGYAVLNFDFRHWGESGGQPRFFESTNEKVQDVLNAIQYLKKHPAIDTSNISLIGVCAGAGVTLRVTALSKDIKNTATVAAWLQYPATTPLFYGGEEGVNKRIALADAAQKKYAQSGEVEYVEAYNPAVASSAMFFPLDYYSNGERGRIPSWDNKFAVMGWKEWLTMNSIDGIAEKIACPVIMVHSDGSALPDNVKRFYNMIPSQHKKLEWMKGEHTQFYDHDEQVDAAIEAILKFFTMEVIKETVHFKSEGFELVGHLYKPVDFDPAKKYAAIVTGGSLTTVKEQMAGTYARRLAEKGFIALAFDYRNYGGSEGQPRQYESPALKLKDLEAAVTYLLSLPYVKAVGALGVCTSGGNVAYLAADDKRVKAAAFAASHLSDLSNVDAFYRNMGKDPDSLRKAGREARELYERTGKVLMIPAYSNTDQQASHVGPMEYYMDPSRAASHKEWKNEFAVMSWETWMQFDPVSKAPQITIPVMMFHSDRCALPDNAKKFYNALRGKKELIWGTGYHFDYYDQPKQIDDVIEKVSVFFKQYVL